MKTHAIMAAAMLCAVFFIPYTATADKIAQGVTPEATLLDNLTPDAQAFFNQSIAIRAKYNESHPYKHFARDRDGDGQIDVMDANGYLNLAPRNTGYAPNPALYGEDAVPKDAPRYVYRLVRDCATKKTIERQIIDISQGYGNYTLTDRYQQQCIDDGSFDNYYVETPDAKEDDKNTVG